MTEIVYSFNSYFGQNCAQDDHPRRPVIAFNQRVCRPPGIESTALLDVVVFR